MAATFGTGGLLCLGRLRHPPSPRSGGRWDDDDRAGGVVGDLLTHRTEQKPVEASSAARTHDEEGGAFGLVEEGVTGVAGTKLSLNIDGGGVDRSDRAIEQCLGVSFE